MHGLEAEMRQWAVMNHIPILALSSAKNLAILINEKKPQHILEVGCAIGYSALVMACACQPSAKITTIELDPARVKLARNFIAKANKSNCIEVIEGNASILLATLDGPYDFVFLDGPKGQYLRQLQQLLPNKLMNNATVVADNVNFRGMVEGTTPCLPRYKTLVQRLRHYISFVSNNPHFSTHILQEADYLAVSHYHKELLQYE